MREARSRNCPVKECLRVRSAFAGLNWFMSKATVEVEMTIPTEEAYEKIAAGTPVEITVKLNNVEGKLYIVQKDQTFLVLNTDPTPAG